VGVFLDDFDRADGGLGGNWSTTRGAPVITSGAFVAPSVASAIDTTIHSATRIEASCHIWHAVASSDRCGPVVKGAAGTTDGYMLSQYITGGVNYLRISAASIYNGGDYASYQMPSAPTNFYELHLVWDQGTLTAYYNGAQVMQVTDNTYALREYAGLACSHNVSPIVDCRILTDQGVSLTVTPNPCGNFGDPVEMTATGENTDWTPGTPGSPVLSVSNGAISGQVVASATSMTFTWTLGTFLGQATFTDPTTGASCVVIVTSDPAYLPGITGQFSEEAVAYIERSAIAETDPTIANREMVVSESGPSITLRSGVNSIRLATQDKTYIPDGDAGVNALADILWRLVNGGYEPPTGPFAEPSGATLKEDLATLIDSLAEYRGESQFVVADLLYLLGGDPIGSHRDILTAIDALGSVDLQPVLDAIDAARGDPDANLREIVTHLDALRTVNDWTLGNVKAWIEAADHGVVDLQPVLTAISSLSSQLTTTQTNIRNDIASLGLVVVAVQTTVGTVSTAVGGLVTAVASILELVQALHNTPAIPLWPGIAGVDLGTPLALSDGMTIDGPLDGLLIHFTAVPAAAQRFSFGSQLSYKYSGAVMFGSDNGQYEMAQNLGAEHGILTPKTMIRADSAVLRLGSGFAGTVTPWVIASS